MTSTVEDVAEAIPTERTPCRVFRERAARERLDRIARVREALQRPPLELIAAYSLKTNPRIELLRMARERGFFAEVISPDELRWAMEAGFGPGEIIYNGPEPIGLRPADERLSIVFADSLEAFARNVRLRVADVAGIRLRPSMIASRFGVPLDEERELRDCLAAMPPGMPIGFSFHVRRQDFKGAAWRDVAGDVLERAVALHRRTGRAVVAFDVGGGWTPEEFDNAFEPDIRWLAERIASELPGCTRLIFEPGQAVCTPLEALVTRVLEVRERPGRREAIIDLAYSDWPLLHAYVHGIFIWCNERWEPLGRGPDRLGGRTCLEYDLIDGLRFPERLASGDLLLVADTGSYDHSMSFNFAAGERVC